jgi:hypothetical protein
VSSATSKFEICVVAAVTLHDDRSQGGQDHEHEQEFDEGEAGAAATRGADAGGGGFEFHRLFQVVGLRLLKMRFQSSKCHIHLM